MKMFVNWQCFLLFFTLLLASELAMLLWVTNGCFLLFKMRICGNLNSKIQKKLFFCSKVVYTVSSALTQKIKNFVKFIRKFNQ